MIKNQLGRRNLSEFVRFELESALKDILLEKGKAIRQATLKQGNELPDMSTIVKTGPHNTRENHIRGLQI